ncbi:hypothetical protein Q4I32_005201 [Leishmania shawi]|uniref:Secreted protein n=1 Tax=Leishmania shawi TaxID=5680 RepID=A0AAW3BLI5_9TRYP
MAAKLSLTVQLELMWMATITAGFTTMVDYTEDGGGSQNWDGRTLRVRIGFEHCTGTTTTYDAIHRRYRYNATGVNRCVCIEAVACEVQSLHSHESFKHLKSIREFHDEPYPYIFHSTRLTTSPRRLIGVA